MTTLRPCFRGQQPSIFHCSTCTQTPAKFEPFLHLTASIAPTLEARIRNYCAQESLEGPCLTCGVQGGIEKRLRLYVMPPVLIVQIHRATNDLDRIHNLVAFPIERLIVFNMTYDLAAVVTDTARPS